MTTKMKTEIKNRNRRTARANAAFTTMTKSEKRVKIAKDVIAQLRARKIKAVEGTYLSVKPKVFDFDDAGYGSCSNDTNSELSAADTFSNAKSCTACAVGSMFLAAVGMDKKSTIKDLPNIYTDELRVCMDGYGTYDYLKKFFTDSQLNLMENAFEITNSWFDMEAEDDKAAVKFGKKYRAAGPRLIAIMENVVKNKGVFKPKSE